MRALPEAVPLVLFVCQVGEAGKIFADNIKFEIDTCADFYVFEIGVFEGVGNYGYAEGVAFAVTDSQAHTVDGNRTFFDSHVAFCNQFGRDIILEFEIAASIKFFDVGANRGGIDVALNDVSVKTAVHEHRTLQVDQITGFEIAEVGAVERFGDGGDCVAVVAD